MNQLCFSLHKNFKFKILTVINLLSLQTTYQPCDPDTNQQYVSNINNLTENIQNKNCIENCDNNVWYNFIYQIESEQINYQICSNKTSCPPPKPQQTSEYNFVVLLNKKAGNQCVSVCYKAEQFTVTNFDNTCVEDCGSNVFHRIPLGDELNSTYQLCDNKTSCDVVSIPPEQHLEDNECKQCDLGFNYVDLDVCFQTCIYNSLYRRYYVDKQNQSCIESCEGRVWGFVQDGQFDVARCRDDTECIYNDEIKEYIIDNTRECLIEMWACDSAFQPEMDIGRSQRKYQKDKINHICHFDFCKSFTYDYYYQYKYDENAYDCIQTCGSIYYYHHIQDDIYDKQFKVCDNIKQTCPPTKYDDEKFQYTQSLIRQNNQLCIQYCIYADQFVSETNDTICVDECQDEHIFKYQNNDNYCTEDSQCNYDKNKEYSYDNEKTCIKESQACLGNVNAHLIKNNTDHSCQLHQNCFYIDYYYVNEYSENSQCVEQCYGVDYVHNTTYYGYPVQVKICNMDKYTCPPDAPNKKEYEYVQKLTIFNQYECVSRCRNQGLQEFNQVYDPTTNTCIRSCRYYFWFNTNDEQNYCTDSCPPEENQLLIKSIDGSNQCIARCKDDDYYQYQISETEKICIHSCSGIWREINDDNICQEGNCIQNETITEYELYDTHQCIDIKDGCPVIDQLHYTQDDDDKICYDNSCFDPTNYYMEKYDENTTECYSLCYSLWFYQKVTENRQVRVCRENETSCPPQQLDVQQSLRHLVVQQFYQCVEKCDNLELYFELLTQPKCEYHIQCISERLNSVLTIRDNKRYLQCTNQSECTNLYPYTDFDVITRVDFGQDIIQFLFDTCSDQCKMKTWTKINYQKVCTENCGNEPDHFSLDISTYECGALTYTECTNQYHIEVDQFNTKCQYVKGAQNCQAFEDYGRYIYQDIDNDKLCIRCDQKGYKAEHNVCMKDSQKPSGRIISGIIIACVIVIAILVLVIAIVIQKKQGNNKQNNDNSTHEINVAVNE